MDLDEAIRYYSHLADECRRKANIERYDYMDLKDFYLQNVKTDEYHYRFMDSVKNLVPEYFGSHGIL